MTSTIQGKQMLFKEHMVSSSFGISADSYGDYDYASSPLFNVDGYTMVAAIPLCYDGRVVCSNFTATRAAYFNKTSSAITITAKALCIYEKD